MSGEAYDTCIHVTCPRCGAGPDRYCRNPVNDKPARVPCLDRLKTSTTHSNSERQTP